MGAGLSHVSPNRIPCPTKQDQEVLESMGLKFENIPEQRRNSMISIQLPEKWGLIEEFDRGDIWYGYLINDEGQKIGHINWMSKGSYDNTCSIRLSTDEKWIDTSKVTLCDGWLTIEPSDEVKFYNLYNKYFDQYESSQNQDDLDIMYNNLINWNNTKHYVDDIQKLVQVADDEKLVQAMRGLAIRPSKRFQDSEKIPWKE